MPTHVNAPLAGYRGVTRDFAFDGYEVAPPTLQEHEIAHYVPTLIYRAFLDYPVARVHEI